MNGRKTSRQGLLLIALLTLGIVAMNPSVWPGVMPGDVVQAQTGPSVWIDTEASGGCHATWTQRGSSSTFDYVASDCGNVTATLTITIAGQAVTVSRTGSSDGNNCTYTGTLSADGRSVSGTQTCTRSAGTFTWSATISSAGTATGGTTGSSSSAGGGGTGGGGGAGSPMVWTVNDAGTQNPAQYHVFDRIQVCFSQPAIWATVLTDTTSDGVSTDIYEFGGSAQTVCLDPDVVVSPLGTECIRMDFTNVDTGSQRSVQTCWQNVP